MSRASSRRPMPLADMWAGVNAHRMSLSWSRIIPGGARGQPVNQKGVEFYRRVIKALLDAGIVSLHHLPPLNAYHVQCTR